MDAPCSQLVLHYSTLKGNTTVHYSTLRAQEGASIGGCYSALVEKKIFLATTLSPKEVAKNIFFPTSAHLVALMDAPWSQLVLHYSTLKGNTTVHYSTLRAQ